MYIAKAQPEFQRMDILADQALTPEDFKQWIENIRREAEILEPGWVAAVDLRGMWVNNPFINEQFEMLQEALLSSRAGKIGTLLDSDPLKFRLWQVGSKTKSNVITRRFHNLSEWEQFISHP